MEWIGELKNLSPSLICSLLAVECFNVRGKKLENSAVLFFTLHLQKHYYFENQKMHKTGTFPKHNLVSGCVKELTSVQKIEN